MTLYTPETLAYSCSRRSPGTAGNGSTAYPFPVPPLYRAGTGERPGTTPPSWLAEKINLSRRAARREPCPKCAADTLVGPDHDACSVTARVDLTPADPIREVIALLAGRHSYDHDRGALYFREIEHVRSLTQRHQVLLTHVCTLGRLF